MFLIVVLRFIFLLLIDGNRFHTHKIPNVCVVKGDSKYLSIAAASVLAKTYRDDYMEDLSNSFPEYQWFNNKRDICQRLQK